MATVDNEFDAKTAALNRRRKMAELLQVEALKPITGAPIQGRTSFLEPLGQMAKAFAAMKMGKDLDKEDAANQAAQNEAFQSTLARMPQGTEATLGTPEMGPPSVGEVEIPASGPGAVGPPSLMPATGFQPAIAPTEAKPPSWKEMLPWTADLARTSPQGRDLAKAFEPRIAENMFPKAITPEQIANLKSLEADREARRDFDKQRHLDNLDMKERQLQESARQANLTDAMRRDIADQRTELMRQRYAASGGGEGKDAKYDPVSEVSLATGRGLVKDKSKGTYHERLSNGSIDPNPYGGETTTKVEYAKTLKEMAKAAGGSAMLMELAKDAESNAPAFTTQAKWDTNPVANFFGKGRQLSGMTPEQATFRAQVFGVTTNLKHSMYGATLTPAESADAAKWVVTDNDDFTQVQSKLRGRAAFEADKLKRMTPADKAQLRARGIKLPDDEGATPSAGGGGVKAPPGVTVVN